MSKVYVTDVASLPAKSKILANTKEKSVSKVSPAPSVIVIVLLELDHAVVAFEPEAPKTEFSAITFPRSDIFPTASLNVRAKVSPAVKFSLMLTEVLVNRAVLSITSPALTDRF